MLKTFKSLAFGTLVAIALSGCNAEKQVVYLQDAQPGKTVPQISQEPIKLKPNDEIMIYVSCTDPETAARLSLLSGARGPEQQQGKVIGSSTAVMLPYTINNHGDIHMPEVGKIHAAGLTRLELSNLIQDKIIAAKLVKDDSVNITIQYANLTYTTLGELTRVGTYDIPRDDFPILEAISISGDLTIYGRRDAVWVFREQPDGSRLSYKLNLLDSEFMKSPAYYIQQNDIIYVEPNTVRAGQSTLNENTFRSAGFWTSLTSIAISIATLIVTLSR